MFLVPKKYNIVLTFSPIEEITGHWFEVFEYYVFLKENNYSPCMLFHTSLSKEIILETLREKYIFSFPEEDVYTVYDEKLIACPCAIVLVCDGNFSSLEDYGIKILAKKILGFGCGNVTYPYGMYKDAIYLLDKRVYDVSYGIPYIKKIYADILRRPQKKEKNTLMYLTKNCRLFEKDSLKQVFEDYKEYKKHLIITNEESYQVLSSKKVEILVPPVKNFFDKFETYIYTPIPRKFDCSPRLIAECFLFGRNVDYYHIDYFDRGLETRKKDIQTGNVWLKNDDEILRIVKSFL